LIKQFSGSTTMDEVVEERLDARLVEAFQWQADEDDDSVDDATEM